MEQENVNSEYIKGFNEGYIMRKHLPELANKLRDIKSTSDRSIGFNDGQKQFERELDKDKQPEWLKPMSGKGFKINKGKDKGRDLTPDR